MYNGEPDCFELGISGSTLCFRRTCAVLEGLDLKGKGDWKEEGHERLAGGSPIVKIEEQGSEAHSGSGEEGR